MQEKFNQNIYIVFALGGFVFLSLHLISSYNTSPLWWGFDNWRFMPSLLAYIFFLTGCLSLVPRIQQLCKSWIVKLGHMSTRIPLFIWLPVSGILLYVFRQRIFLLGDGRLRIQNSESNYLFSIEEPLDTLLHTASYNLLHPHFEITGKEIYQFMSVFFGVIALWGLIYYLTGIYKKAENRWFIGGLIATSGTVQLFFGYVESYTLVNCFSLLFLLSTLLMLKRHRLTVFPALFLSLAVITHPVAVLMLPGALYAYQKVIHRNKADFSALVCWLKPAGIFVVSVLLLIIVFWSGGVKPAMFLEHYLHGSNILPFISTKDQYGIFSLFHVVDILNEIVLVVPASFSLFFILSPMIKVYSKINMD